MMASKDKSEFHFELTYFDAKGRFIKSTVVSWKCRYHLANQETAYLQDAVAKLRGLRNNGGQWPFPKLINLKPAIEHPVTIAQVVTRGDIPPNEITDDPTNPANYEPYGVPHLLLPG